MIERQALRPMDFARRIPLVPLPVSPLPNAVPHGVQVHRSLVRGRLASTGRPRRSLPISGSPLAFVLFIVMNAVLLLRPGEIVPDLEGMEIYFYAVALCSLLAASDVLRYLTGTRLQTQPITWCILGMWVLLLLPNLVVLKLDDAWKTGFHYFKNIVYFLLFVSIVTTPARLRAMIGWLLVIGAAVVVVAVLDYHHLVSLPNLRAVRETEVNSWGEVASFERLQYSGLFKDPNDLCVWLAALVPLGLYGLLQSRSIMARLVALTALPLFGYAIYLTRSRGGFLALIAGLGVTVGTRYGWRRAGGVAAIGLPLLLLMFAGRQTSMDATTSTGQTRVQLWSDWMDRFRSSPLIGVGVDMRDIDPAIAKDGRAVVAIMGHAAHNSYLQAFADIGFAGGCLFLGAFGVALWSLWRIGQSRGMPLDPPTHELQPFMLGAVAAYSVGMLTLSLWFVAPTYIVLALAVSHARIDQCEPPVAPVRFDLTLVGRFVLAGIAFLAAMYLFVRMFVNWG
jgi:hypothetical protein